MYTKLEAELELVEFCYFLFLIHRVVLLGTLLVGGASLQLTRWVGLFTVTCSACTERWVKRVSCDGHVTWGACLSGTEYRRGGRD